MSDAMRRHAAEGVIRVLRNDVLPHVPDGRASPGRPPTVPSTQVALDAKLAGRRTFAVGARHQSVGSAIARMATGSRARTEWMPAKAVGQASGPLPLPDPPIGNCWHHPTVVNPNGLTKPPMRGCISTVSGLRHQHSPVPTVQPRSAGR